MNEKDNRLPLSVYWRRRAAVIGAIGAATGALWLGAEAIDNAIKHSDDPIPAGCTAELKPGQDYWTLADRIDEHTSLKTGEIVHLLSRANRGTPADELQPGLINVPDSLCHIVGQPEFDQ
jgi:hypothetical protein